MILGIDPGARRYGLALADPRVNLAFPLEVVDVEKTDPVQRIQSVIREHGVTLIVVGLPLGLSGTRGPAVEAQRDFVERLRAAVPVTVEEQDERLTTVVAEQGMRRAGARRPRRSVDAVAAQVMLQGYLDGRNNRRDATP